MKRTSFSVSLVFRAAAAAALVAALAPAQAQLTGELERCPPGLKANTPDAQFEDAGPGLVLHKPSGLMWKRCSEGQSWNAEEKTCDGETRKFKWDDAVAHVARVNQQADTEGLGHGDWRLPEVGELQSLIEYACRAPALNTRQFPGTGGWLYWSATPVTGFDRYSWGVYFEQGNSYWYSQRLDYRVRLVRTARPAASN
ncbi:MAG: DUF1566 domain-containing protein [Ottowia sp.]